MAKQEQHSSRPPRWAIRISVIRVLCIEILLFIAIALFYYLPHLQWYYLVAIYAAATACAFCLACVTFRFHTIPGWIGLWILHRHSRKKYTAEENLFTWPTTINQHDEVGALLHEDYLISVIELFAPTRSPIFVERGIATYQQGGTVPIDPLIDALHQYDVNLDSIDIVNIGSRIASRSTYNPIYNAILAQSPAVGKRRTFVIIRLRTSNLLNSIQLRGGGAVGISKTIKIVTRRTLRLIKEEGTNANILSKDQLSELIPTLYEKLIPQKSSTLEEHYAIEKWSHVEVDRVNVVTTYAIDPGAWTIENQNSWWRWNTIETTTITRITPISRDVRDGAHVEGWIRYVTDSLPSIEAIETSGIRLVHGQQLRLATLPIFHLSPLASTESQPLHIYAGDTRFQIPIGPTGQFFGQTINNRQVFLDLRASGGTHLAPRYVLKNLDQKFISQLALRALSTGAKIKVHSPDWSHWRNLIEVAQSSDIWIEGDNDRQDATIIIYDRAIARGEISSRTILSIDTDDHFPKNVIVGVSAPRIENPFELQIDLGDKIGIVEWSINKAEEQYLADAAYNLNAYEAPPELYNDPYQNYNAQYGNYGSDYPDPYNQQYY